MTIEDYISSAHLSTVTLELIKQNSTFKDIIKSAIPGQAADIESSSTNTNCSCRDRVAAFIKQNTRLVGEVLYNFTISTGAEQYVLGLFETATLNEQKDFSGKIAQTTLKDWPDFVASVKQAKGSFTAMSTSIVDDKVYVFFL